LALIDHFEPWAAMIINDEQWLEEYALYRERYLLGPIGRFSDQATEMPCGASGPGSLRCVRHGEAIPFLRWQTEDVPDPLFYPARLLTATRLVGDAASPEDLEVSGLVGIEHSGNLWHSALAILMLTCEGSITLDSEPARLAWGISRALRRLALLSPGYQELSAPGPDGWGYLLRSDAIDDTTEIAGSRTSNFCDWLRDRDRGRGLEPSALEYLGLLGGLVLARRVLQSAVTPQPELLAEIEARIRQSHAFLAESSRYRLRLEDGRDVQEGACAFAVAWPLARIAAEAAGTRPENQIAPFRTDELSIAIQEFSPAADRSELLRRVLSSIRDHLYWRIERAFFEAASPDAATVLRTVFPRIWHRDVVMALNRAADQYLQTNLAPMLAAELDAWLDAVALTPSATLELAQVWWKRLLVRVLYAAAPPTSLDSVPLTLRHISSTAQVEFPARTIQITTPTPDGPVDWPPIDLPAVAMPLADEVVDLHLTLEALGEEILGSASLGQARIQIRRTEDDVVASELAAADAGPVKAICFSPTDDSVLASGHWNGMIRLRDVRNGAELAAQNGQAGPIESLVFTPDGQMVAAGTQRGPIVVFGPASGNFVLPGHPGGTLCLATTLLSAARGLGTLVLASGGGDGVIRLWDLGSAAPIGEWAAHAASVSGIALIQPGPRGEDAVLISAGRDGAVRTWDLASGEILSEPIRSPEPIFHFALSADRSTVATAGASGAVRIWNRTTGIEYAVIRGLLGPIAALSISPDDTTLFVATADGSSVRYPMAALRSGFSDRFNRVDDNNAGPQWDVLSGTWSVNGTRLIAGSSSGRLLFRQRPSGPNLGVRAITRKDLADSGGSGTTAHGLLVRVMRGAAGLSGYEAVLTVTESTGRVEIRRILDDDSTVVAQASVAARIGRDHGVELLARQGDLTLLVDDVEVLTWSDANPLGLDEPTQIGLSWTGATSEVMLPRWDDFQIRPLAAAELTRVEAADPVTACAFSLGATVGDTGQWLAVATPAAMAPYPWRIAAVAAADPGDVGFDALASAARDGDGLLAALAHRFLNVPAAGATFADLMSLVSEAPPGFPHSGAPDGWDRTFRWLSRAGTTPLLPPERSLSNGLDFLAATVISAAADAGGANRIGFRHALLLDPITPLPPLPFRADTELKRRIRRSL
jgi:WD40 repeat protein